MTTKNRYSLILASQSPRRKELLQWLQVPFLIIPADVDESLVESDRDNPNSFVQRLAQKKAQAVIESCSVSDPFIIASDTTVCLNQKILNKPANLEEARAMLELLSGQTHLVYTAIAFKTLEREMVFSVRTEVEFAVIEEDVMQPYLASGDSLDKAGAYGIQGMGLTFVKSLKGSYSNVVGFPLVECLDHLKKFLSQEGHKRSHWREAFR